MTTLSNSKAMVLTAKVNSLVSVMWVKHEVMTCVPKP